MMSLSPEITRLLQYNRQVRLVVGGFVRERERERERDPALMSELSSSLQFQKDNTSHVLGIVNF